MIYLAKGPSIVSQTDMPKAALGKRLRDRVERIWAFPTA